MGVLWMEVRIQGICHLDYQDNPDLHFQDYHLSHQLMRSQSKKVLEALSHHQVFHEECDLLDPEFHQDLFLPESLLLDNVKALRHDFLFYRLPADHIPYHSGPYPHSHDYHHHHHHHCHCSCLHPYPSHPHPVGAVMVGVFAAYLFLIIHHHHLVVVLSTPLCSSHFCPTSHAHGHGGWCCVTLVLCRHSPGPSLCHFCHSSQSHGHGGSGSTGCHCWYLGLVLVVVLSFLVWVIGITLCHLVSNNKMKREKNSTYFFCL